MYRINQRSGNLNATFIETNIMSLVIQLEKNPEDHCFSHLSAGDMLNQTEFVNTRSPNILHQP